MIMVSPDAPIRTPKFYGREAELKKMLTHLSGPPGRKTIVLWGLGSFGKSQIALKFQSLHHNKKASQFGLTSKFLKHSPHLKILQSMFLSMSTLLPPHRRIPHVHLYNHQDFQSINPKPDLRKSQIATG